MTQYELFAQEPQPAIALYRFWKQVLDFTGRDKIPFGERGWGLSYETIPGVGNTLIGFGQMSQWGNYPHFYLAPDGRFRLNNMHGGYRRAVIAQNVPFLGWSFTHSRYQWYVSFDPHDKKYYGGRRLTDWQSPIHYVSEDLLGCRTYRQNKRWLVLERFPGEWRIMPSTQQSDPWATGQEYENARKEWDRYEKLTLRRYLKAENLYRQNHNLPLKMSVRTPTVRSGGQVLPSDQAVNRLLALLEIDQPAKTTPLKRLKEAHHGADNLAPTNHL